MIDHLSIHVADVARSKSFYGVALAPLGYVPHHSDDETAGFGPPARGFFWIERGDPSETVGTHVAFVATDRAAVDAFHAAALAAGGRDNGAPGLRPDNHANYYGAFVLDPDGHNVEAVCHRSP